MPFAGRGASVCGRRDFALVACSEGVNKAGGALHSQRTYGYEEAQ